MHMYHSWGSQNAWLRQITSTNKLHIHRAKAEELGIADGDWVWIESRLGRVKGQVKLITGVNKNTVWTWNAIGKRKGAWGLDEDSPENNKGFLLNHIISNVLAEKHGNTPYSNSDPVTGQAAWFDLKVKITKCSHEESGSTEPMFEAFSKPAGSNQDVLRYGQNLKGPDSGGQAMLKEYIGQRHANAQAVDGISDGHGNQTFEEQGQ